MTKPKANTTQTSREKASAVVHGQPLGKASSRTSSQAIAEALVDGTFISATAQVYAKTDSMMDGMDLVASMKKAGDEVVAGDFSRVERLLTYQLLTLNEMFCNLAQRASRQDAFKGIDTLTRLAFKAQSQARATAETLSLMKNPQPYIKQANIAHGHQQVNNGKAGVVPAGPRAEKIESAPNELLENPKNGLVMDPGAPRKASCTDSPVEALGEKYRAQK